MRCSFCVFQWIESYQMSFCKCHSFPCKIITFHWNSSSINSLKCVFFTSQFFQESIINDIRKARNLYTGKELAAELARILQRVDNIEVLTSDIVINLLLSYRDIQVRTCLKSFSCSILGVYGSINIKFQLTSHAC